MPTAMAIRERLKAQITSSKLVVAPGVYDGLTGHLASNAGFETAYMTGAGTSIRKGYPDYGLLTMTEMVDNASDISAIDGLAVIADADTGYGNELNVTRTVQAYERAGVAAIHIEDQGFPKRCGHLDDKEIIPLDAYTAKIRAAVAARHDPNFLIIARTDARAVIGLEDAIRRANAALDAGADIAFVEAPQTLDEVRAVPKSVNGPCLFNLVYGGKTPAFELSEIEDIGFALAILPDVLLRSIMMTCEGILGPLKASGTLPDQASGIVVREMFERVGASDWDRLRTQFESSKAEAAE
ncbi:MAG: isocitrate lyase/PEP mutase family protein [Pseudomonadota bacterium]